MATTPGSGTQINYHPILEPLIDTQNGILTAQNNILQNQLTLLNDTMLNMRNDIKILRERGENENLGIFVSNTCRVCTDYDRVIAEAIFDSWGGDVLAAVFGVSNPGDV